MLFLFKRQSPTSTTVPMLTALDESLYPMRWNDTTVASAQQLLLQYVQDKSLTDTEQLNAINQRKFSDRLLSHPIYQDWINFTVFGRYIQRSFSAFYRQSEDIFNADMPEILRHELMRHTQALPLGQVLLFGGKLSLKVRQDKLLLTTLNPFTALDDAIKRAKPDKATLQPTKPQGLMSDGKRTVSNPLILNFVTVSSDKVRAFAVKHNKRTSDSLRNEVMILDFSQLTLLQEQVQELSHRVEGSQINNAQSEVTYLIRHYKVS